MTGIPQQVLDQISCGHCWHDTDLILVYLYPNEREKVCCWCDKRIFKPELNLKIIPGHGKHYPFKWAYTG